MRKAFIKALCEAAKKDKRIVLLTGDLGFNVLEEFQNRFPERFFNIGVAEANLVTVAAGLSTVGFHPFIYSIATFITMRPFEQIRNDVSLQNLNVKIVGIGGGLSYTKAGPTHHSMEDIALMRTLGNISIIAPFDQEETYLSTSAITKHEGPAYLRIGRNPEITIQNKKRSFILGKGIQAIQGDAFALCITGATISIALETIKLLKKKNIQPSLYIFSTIKPIDVSLLKKIAKEYKVIYTLEDHRIDGGFGSEVRDVIDNQLLSRKIPVIKMGLKNTFSQISADYDELLEHHELTPQQIVKQILSFQHVIHKK